MTGRIYPQSNDPVRGRPRQFPKMLRKHLEVVAREVTYLNHFHEVFLQFNDILRQSPINQTNSAFWSFEKWAFVGELVHRVDRVCERQWPQKKKRVHSLGAFLEDIHPHLSLINRCNYIGATPNTLEAFRNKHPRKSDPFIPEEEFHRLNRELDKYLGKTKFALTPAQLERDKRLLRKQTKRVTYYRNKHLAHIPQRPGRMRPPNLRELNSAIKHITQIAHKYFLLINVGSHAFDFGQVDITGIFMQPWIKGPTERDALRSISKQRNQNN